MSHTSPSSQRGTIGILAVVIGLGLFAALAFSLNAPFTSRIQDSPQTTGKLEAEEQPTAATPKQPRFTHGSFLEPVPTIDLDQSNPSTDWTIYNSSLGYSIKYPPNWFATSHPSIAHADVFYDRKDYLQILTGQTTDHRRSFDTDFSIVVQQFTFDNLSVRPTKSVRELTESIDQSAEKDSIHFSVVEQTPFRVDDIQALWRKVEEGTSLKLEIVFTHKDKVYMVYTYLGNSSNAYRRELFNEFASTLQLTQ